MAITPGISDFNSRIVILVSPVCSFQRTAVSPAFVLLHSAELEPSCSDASRFNALTIFGGHKAVVRPDPIPNSAVKRSLADGSGFIDSARVGCRQFFKKAGTP